MSKKVLLMLPISLIIVITTSCSWFSIKRDYASEYNPSRLLTRRNNCNCHYIRYNELDLTGNIVDKVLGDVDDVDEYTLYEGTPELSGTSFELSLNFPSFWAPSYKGITFYENGYAQTGYYDYDKKVSYTYYYEFDKDVAKSICKNVKDEYDRIKEQERLEQEERERVEAEYNQMIEDMTIFTVIEKMKEERVDLEFSFLTDEEDPRYYRFTFRDDGSIYTSLKNATYSESNHNTYIDEYDSLNLPKNLFGLDDNCAVAGRMHRLAAIISKLRLSVFITFVLSYVLPAKVHKKSIKHTLYPYIFYLKHKKSPCNRIIARGNIFIIRLLES